MSTMREPVSVTAELLRSWGLPDPGESKKDRGDVIVVGGSRRTPGGVMLAGEAALRVGAGRLAVLAPGSIDAQLGAVLPEAAIFALPDEPTDPVEGPPRDQLAAADAVLFGPGFDDAEETLATLVAVAEAHPRCLVLDAWGLGVLPRAERSALPERLVLTPNREELTLLREAGSDGESNGDDGESDGSDGESDGDDADELADVVEVARRYGAVVTCYGTVADPTGHVWRVPDGGPGLGTSGSGDVLSGAIAGFAARGLDLARAAVWGTWVHARAGEHLTERLGLGFLARELAPELALAVREVS